MAAYASTCTTIEDAVIAKLRLDATADRAKVTEAINQTLCQIAVETKCISGSSTGAALAAAATSQALPAAIIEVDGITCTYGGQAVPLTQVSFDKLLLLRQQTGASGPPWVFCLRLSTVEVWPAAAGGEVLIYYGATMPNSIATSGTAPAPIIEPFASKLLEYGALVQMGEFKLHPLLADSEQKFEHWMKRFNAFLGRRGRFQQSFEVKGSPASLVPHDPSSDWSLSPWL